MLKIFEPLGPGSQPILKYVSHFIESRCGVCMDRNKLHFQLWACYKLNENKVVTFIMLRGQVRKPASVVFRVATGNN